MATVSIITPCYKAARYITRTINSVREQTLRDWEHIIVDDGSPDDSADLVNSEAQIEPRLRLIRQTNGGVSNARNRGFASSDPISRYLLFLDADDCLHPQMLETIVSYLDAHPEVGLVCCEYERIDDNDEIIDPPETVHATHIRYTKSSTNRVDIVPSNVHEASFTSLFAWSGIFPSVSMIRRSCYMKTPGWDEIIGQPAEDMDLFFHLSLRTAVHFVPQPLVRYRVHMDQSTRNNNHMHAQQKKLYAKWLDGEGLTDEQRAMVRQAWDFRERTLMPYLYRQWAKESFSKGAMVDGAKQYYRFLRKSTKRKIG